MNYQEELRTALEKVQGVIEKHWNEIQDDENCPPPDCRGDPDAHRQSGRIKHAA